MPDQPEEPPVYPVFMTSRAALCLTGFVGDAVRRAYRDAQIAAPDDRKVYEDLAKELEAATAALTAAANEQAATVDIAAAYADLFPIRHSSPGVTAVLEFLWGAMTPARQAKARALISPGG